MSMIIDGTNGITFNNSTVQASAGSVLQVVNATYSTVVSNSTSTYADTGITASITPKFATSKIAVLVVFGQIQKSASSAGDNINFNICRNGSQLAQVGQEILYTNTSVANIAGYSINYVDSPATTSSTAYKIQFKNNNGSGAVSVQSSNQPSTMILMEIAG